MYTLTQFLSFAAAGALALSVASIPTRADELAQNLGPVGPNEPFSRRSAASASSHSTYQAVVIAPSTSWCGTAPMPGYSAARVRVSLDPSQMVHIDSAENKSINLQCGDHAETLALVDTSKFVAAGVAAINPLLIGMCTCHY